MVSKSININKTNKSPLTLTHRIQKKTMTYDVENQDPGMRQAQKCGRVKQVNGIPLHKLIR